MSVLLSDEQIMMAFFLSYQSMTDDQFEKLTQIDRSRILSRAQALFAVGKLLCPCRHGVKRLCDCPDCVKEIYEEFGNAEMSIVI